MKREKLSSTFSLKLFSVLRRELKSFCFAEKWEEEDEVVE
jgi:hypothetical protein